MTGCSSRELHAPRRPRPKRTAGAAPVCGKRPVAGRLHNRAGTSRSVPWLRTAPCGLAALRTQGGGERAPERHRPEPTVVAAPDCHPLHISITGAPMANSMVDPTGRVLHCLRRDSRHQSCASELFPETDAPSTSRNNVLPSAARRRTGERRSVALQAYAAGAGDGAAPVRRLVPRVRAALERPSHCMISDKSAAVQTGRRWLRDTVLPPANGGSRHAALLLSRDGRACLGRCRGHGARWTRRGAAKPSALPAKSSSTGAGGAGRARLGR